MEGGMARRGPDVVGRRVSYRTGGVGPFRRPPEEVVHQRSHASSRPAHPRHRRLGDDRRPTRGPPPDLVPGRRARLRPRRDEAVLPAPPAPRSRRPFPDRRHPRSRPSRARVRGHRRGVPLRRPQARRVGRVQPVRGHADERDGNPERDRRVPRRGRRHDDPDVLRQGGQSDIGDGRQQAPRREAGQRRDKLPRHSPDDLRQRAFRQRPRLARLGDRALRPPDRGRWTGDRDRSGDDAIHHERGSRRRAGDQGGRDRARRRGVRVQDAGRSTRPISSRRPSTSSRRCTASTRRRSRENRSSRAPGRSRTRS